MIGFLRGTLLQKMPPFLVLDVGGVGIRAGGPMTTFYDLPGEQEEVSLFTHLLVREDAQLLFGFSDPSQRGLFRSLLRVSGVGPRVGLAILSTLTVGQFVQCVRRQDARSLTVVPGIGQKTAERMLLDMRDRIDWIPWWTRPARTRRPDGPCITRLTTPWVPWWRWDTAPPMQTGRSARWRTSATVVKT